MLNPVVISIEKKSLYIIRWPCELIGRNSVRPCKKQNKITGIKGDLLRFIKFIITIIQENKNDLY